MDFWDGQPAQRRMTVTRGLDRGELAAPVVGQVAERNTPRFANQLLEKEVPVADLQSFAELSSRSIVTLLPKL